MEFPSPLCPLVRIQPRQVPITLMATSYQSCPLTPIPQTKHPSAPLTNNTTEATPLLNAAFLSQLYFSATYDATPASFALVTALPSALYVRTAPLYLNTLPTPAMHPNINAFARAGLAGAIVGSIRGGIRLMCLVRWLRRRSMQQRVYANEKRFNTLQLNDVEDTETRSLRSSRRTRNRKVRISGSQCGTRSENDDWSARGSGTNAREMRGSTTLGIVGYNPRYNYAESLRTPMWPSTLTPLLTTRQTGIQGHPRSEDNGIRKELNSSMATKFAPPFRQAVVGAAGRIEKCGKITRRKESVSREHVSCVLRWLRAIPFTRKLANPVKRYHVLTQSMPIDIGKERHKVYQNAVSTSARLFASQLNVVDLQVIILGDRSVAAHEVGTSYNEVGSGRCRETKGPTDSLMPDHVCRHAFPCYDNESSQSTAWTPRLNSAFHDGLSDLAYRRR